MRTTLKSLSLLCGALLFAALGTPVSAAVVNQSVQTDITLDNAAGTASLLFASGLSPVDSGFNPGPSIGNALSTAQNPLPDVLSRISLTTNNTIGPNGGKQYTITVQTGTMNPPNSFYAIPVIPIGTTLANGDIINTAELEFGVGGGGIAFDDFGGNGEIFIHDFRPRAHYPWQRGTFQYSPTSASAFVNGDNTIGFTALYDADSMPASQAPVMVGDFSGAAPAVGFGGFSTSFVVEVVPEPSTVALVSVACVGGLLAYRRRRA